MYGVDAFSGRASDERDRLGQVGVASGETHRDRTAHEWPTTTTRCQVGVEARVSGAAHGVRHRLRGR